MEVQSIDINGGLQDIFSIGNIPSMCLDLVLRNTTDTIFTTNQVKVEIGLKYDSTIEYILLGIFNITDVKKDDFTTKFTCYDNMFKFDTAYFSKLGDTPTLSQVVNELESITGVQFIGSLPTYSVKKLEGFTCREILSYVASICGGNAIITRDGKFTIIYPTDVNRDIGEGVFDLKRDEVKYKIGKVTCQIKEKETISKGSLGTDSMELMFENPWVTETILTDIYNRLNGFEYLGYNMKWQGDLSLDVGDIITYKDIKGVTRKLPILSRKLSYNGGLDSELSAKGETKNSNSFSSSGSMKNKVDRMVTEVAVINEAFINYAKINDADITNLKVEAAKIHNLEAETANINTILAGNIGSGSVQTIHLTGQNVVIDNAVIKDAMIDSVNANKIKAGTIDTNLVTVQGPSGNLLIKDNTIQIKDSSRTRVQIGKDASNDYNMYVWDATGNLMFDATGLKADGIKSKIIRDDMVSDTANINGSKINISSLITEINKDTNTQLIKASKVAIDLTGQSLEVSFNSLKSNVDSKEARNLLIGEKINVASGTVTKEKVADYNYKFTNTTVNNTHLLWNGSGGITVEGKVGEYITLSFWVKSNFKTRCAIVGKSGVNSIEAKNYDILSNTDFQQVAIISKILVDNPTFLIYFSDYRVFNEFGVLEIKNWKLEKGENKNPVWTKAPEDVDEKIQANTTSIIAVQGQVGILISDNTINKGDITTLKNNYTTIDATVNGLTTTVASHTTDITNAQNTADSKAKVFTATPTTPYKIGDIWTVGPSGEIMKCKVARASGAYVASDWEKASKYTDDTKANSVEQRVNTVEQSITATAITTTISSAINAGTSTITTTQFVMDKSGFTVKNGAIKIQNKVGETVLQGDSNGNLNLKSIGTGLSTELASGSMTLTNTNTGAHMNLEGTTIKLYDYSTIDERAEIVKSLGKLTISSFSQMASSSIDLNTETVSVSYDLIVSNSATVKSDLVVNGSIINNKYTSNTGAYDAGKWTKIASIWVVTRYSDSFASIALANVGDGGREAEYATLYIRLKQQNEMSKDPYFDLILKDSRFLRESNFRGVKIQNNSERTQVDIYMQINTGYRNYYLRLNEHYGNIEVYSQQGFLSSINEIGTYTYYASSRNFCEISSANKLVGLDNINRVSVGDSKCRIDTTEGIFRVYTSAIGVDNGIQIGTDGAVTVKCNNVNRHIFFAGGTKTGGTMEIEGTVYGMSPTDSPQTLIEYIVPDIIVNGEIKIDLDPIYIKMIEYYVAIITNSDIKVFDKGKDYIILSGNGTTDLVFKGQRKDADNYFRIMGGLEHGVAEEQTI